MRKTPDDLSPAALAFLAERHLATVTTLRSDGTPHCAAVGITYDHGDHIVRVLTTDGNQKAVNADRNCPAAITHIDGRRWLTLEGTAQVNRDPAAVADAERRYAQRYRQPRANPRRVILEIAVTRIIGARTLLASE